MQTSHFKRFVSGFLIGTADLVPGISGSTIALLLGIYDGVIDALCTFERKSLIFILPILIGMGSAFLLISPLIHLLLSDPSGKSALFFLFFGIMLGAIRVCVKRSPIKTTSSYISLLSGSLLALLVVIFPTEALATPGPHLGPLHPYVTLAGAFAVCAMLLPGISGSYLMVAIGAYPMIIKSLSNIFEGYPILLSLGFGILIGAALFTPLIRFCLHRYSTQTHSLLIGFMIGSLPVLWPDSPFPFFPLPLLGYFGVTFLSSLDDNKKILYN